jgi:enolase-phosphatase E1
LSHALAHRPRAVLLDIEGTVGPISFVREVLFPYARSRLAGFIEREYREPAVAAELAAVARDSGLAATDLRALIGQLQRWSDEDRKVTPLKSLQGMIWEDGYRSGELRAQLYDDAVRALRRWKAAGLPVYIYSSGSVAAQKLYFTYSEAGDLTGLLAGYFDTTTGPKQAPGSYRTIAEACGLAARDLVFFSDIAAELQAAQTSGLLAVQIRREKLDAGHFEPHAETFDGWDF